MWVLAQVVRAHYLRDDIWSGSPLDPESDPSCNKLSADAREYLVVDTNVVLQQVLGALVLVWKQRMRGAVWSWYSVHCFGSVCTLDKSPPMDSKWLCKQGWLVAVV